MLDINHEQYDRQLAVDGATLFISKELNQSQISNLNARLRDKLLDEDSRGEISIVDVSEARKGFCKVSKIDHMSQRLRSTFGIARFHGALDWKLAEIINQLRSSGVEYIPATYAYGYKSSRFGIVQKFVLVTELIEGAVDLQEFIDKNPDGHERAIIIGLNIIKKHIDDGMVHLDLWLKNILVNEDLSQSWLVDLEYCKFNSSCEKHIKIAHCLAYFYQNGVDKYLSKDDYFAIVHKWLERCGYNSGFDKDKAFSLALLKVQERPRKKKYLYSRL